MFLIQPIGYYYYSYISYTKPVKDPLKPQKKANDLKCKKDVAARSVSVVHQQVLDISRNPLPGPLWTGATLRVPQRQAQQTGVALLTTPTHLKVSTQYSTMSSEAKTLLKKTTKEGGMTSTQSLDNAAVFWAWSSLSHW